MYRFIAIVIPALLFSACKANKDEVPVEGTDVTEGTEVVAPVIEGTDVVAPPIEGTDVVPVVAPVDPAAPVAPVAPVEPPPAQ